MELRGYDHYEITLGDEIRGFRASMGKSLADVERELRIKAELIAGIENADLGAFPNPSVVAGYVRSYARYLGMEPEEFYRRFREESGFVPPHAGFGPAAAAQAGIAAAGGVRMLAGSPFDQSRFAVPPSRSRFAARVSLGSVASAFALVGLVAGLGFGGYALLQNMQRVGFAPLPEAPEVVAEAPRLTAPEDVRAVTSPPDAAAYSGNGALAAVLAPDDQPPLRRRDGPISAIDPEGYGVFARAEPSGAERLAQEGPGIEPDAEPLGLAEARARRAAMLRERAAPVVLAAAGAEPPAAPAETGIRIHATDSAWIRVRSEDRAVLFEGILTAGESYLLPERVDRGLLRAGNAGAVYILVDGEPFGPLGKPGGVVKNLSLAASDLRASLPAADGAVLAQPELAPAAARRAAAE